MTNKKTNELSMQHRRLLMYIHEFKLLHPFSPDVREMATAVLGRQEQPISTSVVNYYLDRLEKEGLISFLYLKTRGKHHNVRAARTVHLTDEGVSYINALLKVKSVLGKEYEDEIKRIATAFQVPLSKMTPTK